MNTIAAVRKKFGLSAWQFALLVGCAAVSFAVCIALLLPVVQNALIMLGELLVQRPLNRPVWSGRFFTWGALGVILHCIIFFMFFFLGRLAKDNADKIVHVFKDNADKLAHVVVAAFSIMCVFVIMFRANWACSDDVQYLSTTAIGKYFSPSSYMGSGRFYPLGHVHYNILLFFFRLLGHESGLPVEAHYAVIAMFCVVTVLCLYIYYSIKLNLFITSGIE